MRWSWKIGRLAGINVYMHATFVLLILFILLAYWAEGHNVAMAVAGVVFVLAIFGCIVLHELGHALTARRYGIQTRDIILLPIGGVARLERMPDDPHQELLVALAGPAVNVLIAAAIFVLLTVFGSPPSLKDVESVRWVGGSFLNKLMVTNLWLVGFNILPAFPMDGGRVLRALLATRMEYTRATHVAAQIGQAMAFIFGLIGLLYDPFLLFIALFVWMGATEEAAMVTARTSLGGIPVQRVMVKEFRTLSADDALSVAVDHILDGWQQDFPVVWGDHVLGILTRDDVVRTLAKQGSNVRVRDAMRRDVPTVDSHDMLEKALQTLAQSNGRSIPVEHNGQLVGMLTMENVGEFIMIQTALRQAKALAKGQQAQSPPPVS
ncbi:MAG TPA: site-2 protease family protein [Terriglobia bacterium]|nr:site-2 protease family protein [Terriglobia bacterium]